MVRERCRRSFEQSPVASAVVFQAKKNLKRHRLENFATSEKCRMLIWSIKSGKLLYEHRHWFKNLYAGLKIEDHSDDGDNVMLETIPR